MARSQLSRLGLGRFALGETHLVPIDELQPSGENPRYITEERFADLVAAIKADPEHFLARPCIATPDGVVHAGNMRLRAALQAGLSEVPAFFTERPAEDLRALAIRDNVPYGTWDETALAEWVYELAQIDGFELPLTGLETTAIEDLLAAVSGLVPDDVLPPNLDERNPPAEVVCPECGHTFTPGG